MFYYGNYYLNVLIREMEKHLRYVWTFCHPYQADGLRTISSHGIEQCWKPIVIFAKGDWKSPREIEDMLPDFGREKSRDYWEQSLPLLEHVLDMFSQPDDLILDPLAGTCTIMEACHSKGRRCVACDSNPAAMAHARQRWERIKRKLLRRFTQRRGGRIGDHRWLTNRYCSIRLDPLETGGMRF